MIDNMKQQLAIFLCYILRKLNVSVMINLTMDGGTITSKQPLFLIYGNDIPTTKFISNRGDEFEVPAGPFKITL